MECLVNNHDWDDRGVVSDNLQVAIFITLWGKI